MRPLFAQEGHVLSVRAHLGPYKPDRLDDLGFGHGSPRSLEMGCYGLIGGLPDGDCLLVVLLTGDFTCQDKPDGSRSCAELLFLKGGNGNPKVCLKSFGHFIVLLYLTIPLVTFIEICGVESMASHYFLY